jgi:hypothetical protein
MYQKGCISFWFSFLSLAVAEEREAEKGAVDTVVLTGDTVVLAAVEVSSSLV